MTAKILKANGQVVHQSSYRFRNVTKHAATPAKANLFEVDEQSAKLCEDKANRFHSVVAKLLYISPRGRIDIQLAMAFL
jgi:hypothetical protein